jgi:flagellar basal body-associated protein FliL
MILGDEEEGELILGMMVEKEIVQGYIDFFAEMDITVTCIRNHLAGMMRVVRSLSEVNTKTCIILKMMGDSLGSILLDAGHYKNYMQRRLFHVHGTEEFAMEIGKHVNNTLQFQAGADQNAVTDIYFCGFTEEDRDCCQEMMEMVGYPIRKLKEGKIAKFPSASHCFMDEYREPCIGTYIGSVGNLLSPVGHELNFCNQLAADQKREEKEAKKAKMRKILPPVLLIAFCILVVAVMFGYRLYLSNRLQAANDYINDESNLAQEKKEDEILEETQKLQTEWNQITEAKENLATYPDADSKLLTMVSNLAKKYSVTAEVSSYSSESGVLVIEARSNTEKNIHQYIKALEQKTDTFSKVDYSGYVLNSETGIYTINVNGQLKAKEKE